MANLNSDILPVEPADQIQPDDRLDTAALPAAPNLRQLFVTWARIGLTSYGGGSVVQYLIQEHFILKRQWLTADDYARILAMCQITPGITLLAITITIGNRLGGRRGIIVSLAGLLLPSVAVTVAMTAVYASVRDLAPVQAALRSVFAAIVGVSLATTWRNVRPILAGSRKRGAPAFMTALAILMGSVTFYLVFKPPVLPLYLAGALCGAVVYSLSARHQPKG